MAESAPSVDQALAQHLQLAEQLRGQLQDLQRSLSDEDSGPEEAVPPARTAPDLDDSRARLLSLARALSDRDHLQQLCDLAEQLRGREQKTQQPRAPAPAPTKLPFKPVPTPAPEPAPEPAPSEPAGAIRAVFPVGGAPKLGISFESSSNADPPRIKSIAPSGAAAAFAQLRPGLQLNAIQGSAVAGLSTKECIARIKQAGRPLTLQFVESAHSLLLPRAAGSDSDDSDEEPAPQPAPARARTQLEKQRDYARAEQARAALHSCPIRRRLRVPAAALSNLRQP